MPKVIDLRKKKSIPEKKNLPTKIEWTALEFKKYKKSKKWFVFPTLIALIIIIAAILTKNFLLAIAIILTAFIVRIYAKKEPRKIKFSISGKGIQIDKNIYRFEDLKSFWIFYEPPKVKEISFRSKKTFMPYIKIPLGNQDPNKARELLLKFLTERKHSESIIDEWTRKIKF